MEANVESHPPVSRSIFSWTPSILILILWSWTIFTVCDAYWSYDIYIPVPLLIVAAYFGLATFISGLKSMTQGPGFVLRGWNCDLFTEDGEYIHSFPTGEETVVEERTGNLYHQSSDLNHRSSTSDVEGVGPGSQRQPLLSGSSQSYGGVQEYGSMPRTVEAKYRGGLRFCRKCQCLKPDRAHHCSTCERCVLQMDHHCCWLGQCVGLHNRRWFVHYLLNASAFGLAAAAIDFFYIMGDSFGDSRRDYSIWMRVGVLLNFILTLVFGAALMFFGGFHLKILLQNVTTLEVMEKNRSKVNPFRLSWKENVGQVCGTFFWAWLSPFVPAKQRTTDGVEWPVSREFRG